jgi:hypothetical protein
MNIRPTINRSSRLSFREFDAEMWRLYFGVVRSLLIMITSVLYFFLLSAFFVAQHAAFLAGKFAGWVRDWNPEKPRVFGIRPVDGEEPLDWEECIR